MDVEIENGKYTLRIANDGSLSCLRHGEHWLCDSQIIGGKMLLAVAHELTALRAEVARLTALLLTAEEREAVDKCVRYLPPMSICGVVDAYLVRTAKGGE